MNKLNLLNKWMHRMIIMCDMCSWFMNENNCKKKTVDKLFEGMSKIERQQK